jgi:hypothetical protein
VTKEDIKEQPTPRNPFLPSSMVVTTVQSVQSPRIEAGRLCTASTPGTNEL